MIKAEFPYAKNYVSVFGHYMAYAEAGAATRLFFCTATPVRPTSGET